MAKILILSSGLRHADEMIMPLIEHLKAYLIGGSEFVDVRPSDTLRASSFAQYDKVIFAYPIALDTIPSSLLDIFKDLEAVPCKKADIYVLSCCDEYEPHHCQHSDRVVMNWCKSNHLSYRGSLNVGALYVMSQNVNQLVLYSYLKKMAVAILKDQDIDLEVTVFSLNSFMKNANRYWEKEIEKTIKKERKEH